MAPPNDPTPVPTPPQVDSATSEAAFRRVQPKLEALRPPLRCARTDYYTAVIRGLAAARAASGELKPRFLALPASEFDPANLELLTDSAHALLKARLDAETAMLAASKAKLAASVVQAALELKERTLTLLNYHLREDAAVTRETADIASGRGYVDLANDLGRIARLLRDHQDTLEADTRLYQTEDAGRCEELSHRILEDLGSEQNPDQRRRIDTLNRCWTLFERTYDEVAQTGRWLLRADERRADQLFPSLFALSHPRKGQKSSSPAEPT